MRDPSRLVLAIFDGEKGIVFSVLLIGLLVAGAIVLVVNLAARQRSARPPPKQWEAVPDEPAPQFVPASPAAPRSGPSAGSPQRTKPAPARRRA